MLRPLVSSREPPFVSLTVTLLVLLAALMHASWNAFVRANEDRLSMLGYIAAGSGLAAVPFLPFLPVPAANVWPLLLLSVGLHTGYKLFLAQAYEHGALGHVYPLARGTAPVLVTIVTFVFFGERLPLLALAAVALIAGGIVSLAMQKNGAASASAEAVTYSLITSVFIASYTMADGFGGRLAVTPLVFTVWLVVLDGIVFLAVIAWRRDMRLFLTPTRASVLGLFGGVVAVVGYGIVIWAMSVAPMGPVAALRETSVVFAALISAIVLKERIGPVAIAAACAVAAGVVLLRL